MGLPATFQRRPAAVTQPRKAFEFHCSTARQARIIEVQAQALRRHGDDVAGQSEAAVVMLDARGAEAEIAPAEQRDLAVLFVAGTVQWHGTRQCQWLDQSQKRHVNLAGGKLRMIAKLVVRMHLHVVDALQRARNLHHVLAL